MEQLLLKSFTHWIGTPENTQPHCWRSCAIKGVWLVPLLMWMPRVGVKHMGNLCPLCVLPNAFILIWLRFTLLLLLMRLRASELNKMQEDWTYPYTSVSKGLLSLFFLLHWTRHSNHYFSPGFPWVCWQDEADVLTIRWFQSPQLCWNQNDTAKTFRSTKYISLHV